MVQKRYSDGIAVNVAFARGRLPKGVVQLVGFVSAIASFLGLFVPSALTQIDFSQSHLGPTIYNLLEAPAVVSGVGCFVAAFIGYPTRRDPILPLLGAALFSCAGMDLTRILVSTGIIQSSLTSQDFPSLAWVMNRTCNAIFGIVGSLFILCAGQRKFLENQPATFALAITFTLISGWANYAITFELEPLVETNIRTLEFVLIILFSIMIYTFWLLDKNIQTIFTDGLYLMSILFFLSHLVMCFGSINHYDGSFNIAMILKFSALGIVLFAFVLDYSVTLRAADQTRTFLRCEAKITKVSTDLNLTEKSFYTEVISILGAALDFHLGHIYIVSSNNSNKLEPSSIWYEKTPGQFSDFIELTQKTPFMRGEGLPGRVLASGKAHWIPDVNLDKNFPRAAHEPLPIRMGLGIPIQSGDHIFGVIEFFSTRAQAEQALLLELCSTTGLRLGSMVETRRAQRQLLEAQERATRASEAKSEFLANMSHEIRTPLNGVIGALSLIKDGPLSSEQAEYASTADESAKALLSLLNNVLDISKLEAAKVQLEYAPFSLEKLLNSLSRMFSPLSADKGVQFRCYVEGLPIGIVGDEHRLRQVLVNLIANALKFTHRGYVDLRIKGLPTTAQGHQLDIEVRDTGVGISPQKQKALFNKFTQADSSTTRKYGGTGLGLAISYQLVSLMGGHLELKSTIGKGSRFYFTLTVQETTLLAEKKLNSVDLSNLEVLIVEDNMVNAKVARRMLERLGARVRHAVNGIKALEECQTQLPDIILMDCQMPELDGFETTRQLRQLYGSDLPIIALTANALSGDRELCFDAGMDDFLTKPIRRDDLAIALRKRIDTTK